MQFENNQKLILHFLRGSKRYFLLAILSACLVSLFDLVNPRIIGFVVDSVIGDKPVGLTGIYAWILTMVGGVTYLRTHLYVVALVVIFVALLAAVCRFSFQYNNQKGAERLVKTMRDDLFTHIMHLPFTWHSENHTGDIIQRCTSDVEQIKMFLSEQLTQLVRILILIALVVFFMFKMNITLATTSVIFIPMIVGYSLYFHRHIGDAFEIADIEEGKLSTIAQENLTGVRVVRAFGRESYERKRFETQNEYYTKMWIRLLRLLSMFWSTGDFFSYAQILAVVSVGVVLVVRGHLTTGEYIAFITYNGMLTWPVRGLGRVISNLSKAGISMDRLRYIMNSELEPSNQDAVDVDMHQDIVFDHVHFSYDEKHAEVLKDISFTIKANTTFGILGATGSGKSTLMYLLDRLYPLSKENGKITIGNVDIQDIPLAQLRRGIGMVLQEPYLFSRSLQENIKIANMEASHQEVRHVSRIASLEEAIEHFKEGYETKVGERGVTLSGGQKQRTAIAQMLIRKPPIMVFDDSLSAVDAQTDAKIRHGLKNEVQDSTVILIAHRITTLMHADHIIVLDQGRIVEEGNHQSLLAQNGIYKRIYDLQSQQSEVNE